MWCAGGWMCGAHQAGGLAAATPLHLAPSRRAPVRCSSALSQVKRFGFGSAKRVPPPLVVQHRCQSGPSLCGLSRCRSMNLPGHAHCVTWMRENRPASLYAHDVHVINHVFLFVHVTSYNRRHNGNNYTFMFIK